MESMETTESWVYDNDTVTLNSCTPPPDDGVVKWIARPVMTLTKCNIHTFYVLTVVGSAVVLFGLIGNALTISILRRNHIKSSTHFLLQLLAIADTLVVLSYWLISAPVSLAQYFLKPKYYRNLVSVSYVYIGCLSNTFLMATIWLTVLVTWQRYLSVCLPYKFKTLGNIHIAKVQALAVVIFCLLFNIPRYFERTLIYDQPSPGLISFADTALRKSEAYKLLYSTILFYLFFYILPSLALIYMTGALIVGLRKAWKRRKDMENTLIMITSNNQLQKNKDEVTLSLIIVVVTFMICHFMAPVRRILLLINPGSDSQQCGTAFSFLQPYVVLSTEISSSVNFFIYMGCVKSFRQNFVRMCKREIRIEPQSMSSQTSGNQKLTRRSNNHYPHTMQTGPIQSSHI